MNGGELEWKEMKGYSRNGSDTELRGNDKAKNLTNSNERELNGKERTWKELERQ